ncbi:PAS domain-containing sensor histidine kinase [Nitrospirillum iridis]|uniref:histidine kinase n=1 Tax=Nitrospirillum iridis TaxID=765888 RepID=A0A7X0AT31_9PROT|nr:PAS domain-containing sensor histidine kinase [Nitrospirillum iridis]MBB6249604.1 signal transduction histidine kinase [Nitrospirillum iridis]
MAAQLYGVLQLFSQAIVVFGPDDRVVFANDRYHEMFPRSPAPGAILGWSFEDLLRQSIAAGQVPQADGDPEAYIARRMAQRGIAREGMIGDRWYRAVEERIPGGGIVLSYHDITDRRVAEEELRRKSAILSAAMEAVPGGFMVMDERFNFVVWSRNWPAIGGATDEIVRAYPNMPDLARWQSRRGDYDAIRLEANQFDTETIASIPWLGRLLALQAARPPQLIPTDEERELLVQWQLLRYRPEGRPDGERAEGSGTIHIGGDDGRIVEFRRSRMPGLGWVSIYNDVTERYRREEETARAHAETARALQELRDTQESLVQAEKLASLGELVAGVAHELNTPVGISYTAATFLSDRLREFRVELERTPRRATMMEFLDLVGETADLMTVNAGRAARLVQSFKNIAVDQTNDERRLLSLKSYLEEIAISLSPQWKRPGHTLTIDCPTGLVLDTYPGALSQVLTNLIVNATLHGYAPGQAGRLTITASPLPLAAGGGTGRPAAEHVEILFADDGKGIAPEALPRIFDPFFTTRRGAGSTGLGLNIVFNLVTRTLGGRIEVDSTPGRGTRFFLRLPKVAPQPPASPAQPSPAS